MQRKEGYLDNLLLVTSLCEFDDFDEKCDIIEVENN